MIGNRVREVRDLLDLSRKNFGEKIYVSQDVINNIERGRITPTEFHIKGICEKYNVNEKWLRTGEGEMFNPASQSLDALAEANQVDDLTRAVVVTLLEMSPTQREAFQAIVHKVADKMRSADYTDAESLVTEAVTGFAAFNASREQSLPAEDPEDSSEPHKV